jgi:putative two-component system response regulator
MVAEGRRRFALSSFRVPVITGRERRWQNGPSHLRVQKDAVDIDRRVPNRRMIMNSMSDSRILIVDDEPVNVKVIERTLQSEGYTNIIGMIDPARALGLMKSEPVDLVVLDLNMPVMDGFTVLKRLGELGIESAPPVLMLTAQTDRDSRIKALELGARDFVSKPFDRVELVARVRNLLEMRQLYVQVRSQNDLLESRVRERTLELSNTRLEIVRRLGRAAEYRDNETGLHIIRMSKTSALIGAAAGMNPHDAEMLLHASPMHDIGKIGIPDSILLKRGKLDAQEWAIMKTHTTIGAEILSGDDSELLRMARDVAICHHEKWDGSGYPNGLAREDIPLVGRIVAIADVFDAVTSVRPYKRAWPLQEALDHIRRLSGMHFDPALVDVFFANLVPIIEIRERYAEPGGNGVAA